MEPGSSPDPDDLILQRFRIRLEELMEVSRFGALSNAAQTTLTERAATALLAAPSAGYLVWLERKQHAELLKMFAMLTLNDKIRTVVLEYDGLPDNMTKGARDWGKVLQSYSRLFCDKIAATPKTVYPAMHRGPEIRDRFEKIWMDFDGGGPSSDPWQPGFEDAELGKGASAFHDIGKAVTAPVNEQLLAESFVDNIWLVGFYRTSNEYQFIFIYNDECELAVLRKTGWVTTENRLESFASVEIDMPK